MDKTIELLDQAQARLKAMREDYKLALAKAKETVALLEKHLSNSVPKGPDLSSLSDREKEVLDLMGQRVDDAEISKKLSISEKTVRRHKDNIRAKLNINNGYELKLLAEQIHNNRNGD